jgi:HSP20 family protein
MYGTQRDLQREVNRILNTVFPAQCKPAESAPSQAAAWRPAVDVHENETSYVIDVELPGLTRDDVKISYQDGTLTVSGERVNRHETPAVEGEENAAKRTNRYRSERQYGKFSRAFTFSAAVNSEGISARFENGVLTITVAKAEAVRPRQIEIG